MRNSSWMDWFGAEVGFSIYIHRRGFTSTTTINHQSVLPASQGARARPMRSRDTRAARDRTNTNPTMPMSFTPLSLRQGLGGMKHSSRHAKLLLNGLVWC